MPIFARKTMTIAQKGRHTKRRGQDERNSCNFLGLSSFTPTSPSANLSQVHTCSLVSFLSQAPQPISQVALQSGGIIPRVSYNNNGHSRLWNHLAAMVRACLAFQSTLVQIPLGATQLAALFKGPSLRNMASFSAFIELFFYPLSSLPFCANARCMFDQQS